MPFPYNAGEFVSEWAAKQLIDNKPPALSDSEIVNAFEWTCKYGSGNCWSGTTGEGAAIIHKLLLEIARLRT